MVTIIKEIKIPDNSYSFISDDEEMLKNLSKINIFVGENNSGKSRFLRSLIKKQDLEFIPNNKYIEIIKNAIPHLKGETNEFIARVNLGIENISTGTSNLQEMLSNIEEINLIKPNINYVQPIIEFKNYIESLKTGVGSTEGFATLPIFPGQISERSVSISYVGGELAKIFKESFKDLDEELENINLSYEYKKFYIPILRGLRPLLEGPSYSDLYKLRTGDDYFEGHQFAHLDQKGINIYTGLDAYDTVNLYSRLRDPEKKRLLKDFKDYLKSNFFDGKNIEITASVKEDGKPDVLSVKIGDELEKPIYDLGDGIQSIIILTLQLFLHKNKAVLVFIEEPEQLLHPGLQRKLIETFSSHEGFENFQFFITTHSNHFLDITLDFENISIFTVQKELDNSDNDDKVPSFTIENLSEGDASALELLGVRNSSVFLSNCTIWVEGVTDRHYLRHYLKLYKKEHKEDSDFNDYKEDYHYSFVEYGGNNITHWSFLDKEEKPINVEKLCGRLFLLADKDVGKEERQAQLKETLGENRVHILACNEIENLVTADVLLKIVKDYERIKDGDPLDNLKTEFRYDDYKTELLGDFIEKELLEDIKNKKRKGDYKAESGTINNKDSFLKKSIKYTPNWNDLSPEAQQITQEVHNFIKENNS